MTTKFNAILSLVPGAEIVLRGDVIEWINPSTPPVTQKQIEDEVIRLQQEYENNQYQRDRATEYPSIQAQLDMQYWDSVNGTTTWQDAIAAVKSKYPKNNGV